MVVDYNEQRIILFCGCFPRISGTISVKNVTVKTCRHHQPISHLVLLLLTLSGWSAGFPAVHLCTSGRRAVFPTECR